MSISNNDGSTNWDYNDISNNYSTYNNYNNYNSNFHSESIESACQIVLESQTENNSQTLENFEYLGECNNSDQQQHLQGSTDSNWYYYENGSTYLENKCSNISHHQGTNGIVENVMSDDALKCCKKSSSSSKSKKKKSVYKHVPHSEKPSHLVAKRNARERRRVHAVNLAFIKLRKTIPFENKRGKRISKVRVLKKAINYIRDMRKMVGLEPTEEQEKQMQLQEFIFDF